MKHLSVHIAAIAGLCSLVVSFCGCRMKSGQMILRASFICDALHVRIIDGVDCDSEVNSELIYARVYDYVEETSEKLGAVRLDCLLYVTLDVKKWRSLACEGYKGEWLFVVSDGSKIVYLLDAQLNVTKLTSMDWGRANAGEDCLVIDLKGRPSIVYRGSIGDAPLFQ